MILTVNATKERYSFVQVALVFDEGTYESPFEYKNNKTVQETLNHRRYSRLQADTESKYPEQLTQPLGQFLSQLKSNGDQYYLRFLNKYGDGEYSKFRIIDERVLEKRGIYAFTNNEKLKYIGRCRDSMKKRVNLGYGRISPKNCYLDGQTTNCHLNSLITEFRETVQLWFCELDLNIIVKIEKDLLIEYQPDWNVQRR